MPASCEAYEWYHFQCVVLTKDTLPAEGDSWACPTCIEKEDNKAIEILDMDTCEAIFNDLEEECLED